MNEMKPCPFCGAQPKYTTNIHPYGHEMYGFYCGNEECDIMPYTPYYANIEDAVESWNRRAE